MSHLGTHYILELYGCTTALCDDIAALEKMMLHAIELAGATVINVFFHQFSPYGVSGTIVIAESHFNIHTWPEHNFMAIDLFTCGNDLTPEAARDYLIQASGATRSSYEIVLRGTEHKV